MKITAVGDALIQRRIAPDFEGYKQLRPYIMRGDARFFNLETTLNYEGECCASQFSGGTYMRTVPEVLEDLKAFGFNMTSFNNNHTMDYSYEGMLRTLEEVEKSGLVHAGVGMNLAQASAPKYLETTGGRAALIAVNTSFAPSMMAGEQTPRIPGRPGINGLRIDEKLEVTPEEFDVISRVIDISGLNVQAKIEQKEGYRAALSDNEAEMGGLKIVKGGTTRRIRKIKKADYDRVAKAIEEAAWQSDEVLISIHSHQLDGEAKENTADFVVDFAHFCIDCGATAVIGHGPHLLRPIEIYKGHPIFYSLGDFITQLYNVEFGPGEFYEKYSLTPQDTMYKLLKTRSKDFTVGLMEDRRMMETVIPYWETKDGKLVRLELLPVMGVMKGKGPAGEMGLPKLARDLDFMDKLAKISEPFGTRIKKENGIFVCEL